jgi:hypothetical protein
MYTMPETHVRDDNVRIRNLLPPRAYCATKIGVAGEGPSPLRGGVDYEGRQPREGVQATLRVVSLQRRAFITRPICSEEIMVI